MTVKDIFQYIDSIAPFATQAEWDNSGLLVGDFSAEVRKAVVCLDVTEKEVEYAKKENAQLIISHHPVIFRPQKNFLCGDLSFDAAVNGISIISAHTNLDKAVDGVNDTLCRTLGLDFIKEPDTVCEGFLNTAVLRKPMSAEELAVYIRCHMGCIVNYCDSGYPVTKVGICSGAGADFIRDSIKLGCNGFITGEASYHEFIDAAASGVSLFAAGHYETEAIVVSQLAQKLRNTFNNTVFLEFLPGSTVITEK